MLSQSLISKHVFHIQPKSFCLDMMNNNADNGKKGRKAERLAGRKAGWQAGRKEILYHFGLLNNIAQSNFNYY